MLSKQKHCKNLKSSPSAIKNIRLPFIKIWTLHAYVPHTSLIHPPYTLNTSCHLSPPTFPYIPHTSLIHPHTPTIHSPLPVCMCTPSSSCVYVCLSFFPSLMCGCIHISSASCVHTCLVPSPCVYVCLLSSDTVLDFPFISLPILKLLYANRDK